MAVAIRTASALLALLLPAALAFSAPAGNAALGKDKAEAERCLECHGEAGPGQGLSQGGEGKFARLDGQYADYLVKQVKDFRSGARRHDFMAMMARSLDDADLADIAAWFASQPVKPGSGAAVDPAARRLFEQGDAGRKLLACATCHGANGQGGGPAGPVIKGQGEHYLVEQLEHWRSGARANSPGGIMSQQAAGLTDTEIKALARYISGL